GVFPNYSLVVPGKSAGKQKSERRLQRLAGHRCERFPTEDSGGLAQKVLLGGTDEATDQPSHGGADFFGCNVVEFAASGIIGIAAAEGIVSERILIGPPEERAVAMADLPQIVGITTADRLD